MKSFNILEVTISPNPVTVSSHYLVNVTIEECNHARLEGLTHRQLAAYTHQELAEAVLDKE